VYKGVHTIRIKLISISIIMGEGSTDTPPPLSDNEQSADIPPTNKLENPSPNRTLP